MFKKHLYPINKREYLNDKRNNNIEKCILCAIRDNDEKITKLEVYRNEKFIVTINLYPYNPGHIMIFPKRHIEDIRELNKKEKIIFRELTDRSLDLLEEEYNPHGFNIGINLGRASGASIKHLHRHIVPRYHDELGFIDILSGSKIYIEKPEESYKRLKDRFKKI
jgi:ATP adenylyltransferase